MHGDFIMCPTVCYRRSRLPAERFRAEWRQVLDLDFFTRILLAGGTMVGLPTSAYAYRRHAENATARQTRKPCCDSTKSRGLHDQHCRHRPRARLADRRPRRGRQAGHQTPPALPHLPGPGRLRLAAGPQKWDFSAGCYAGRGIKQPVRAASHPCRRSEAPHHAPPDRHPGLQRGRGPPADGGPPPAPAGRVRDPRRQRRLEGPDQGRRQRPGRHLPRLPLHVAHLPVNCGIGVAVQTGYRFAVADGGYRYVIQFDADGQHDADYLSALVEPGRRATDSTCASARGSSATSGRARDPRSAAGSASASSPG